MLSNEKRQWLQTTLKINVRHKDVEEPEQEDFLRRERGSEYEDEDKKVGFRAHLRRAETPEEKLKQDIVAEMTFRTTQMYTDEEVENNKALVTDRGKLERDDGQQVDGKFIYAVEAESGEMVTGNENQFRLIETATGRDVKTTMGFLDAISFAQKSKGAYQVDNLHHSSLVQGGDVRGAGVVEVTSGEIKGISNTSGHYKPRFEHLLQVVEGLIQSGALLSHEVVDSEGRSVKKELPKAYELYTKLQPRIAALDNDKALIKKLTEELKDEDISEEQTKKLGTELDRLERGVDLVTKGMEALRKMGIGTSNRTKNVDVTLNYASETSTGAEFVTSVATDKMKVSDLVMGQGSVKPQRLEPKPLQEAPEEEIEVTMSQTYSQVIFNSDGTISEIKPVETTDEDELSDDDLSDDEGEDEKVQNKYLKDELVNDEEENEEARNKYLKDETGNNEDEFAEARNKYLKDETGNDEEEFAEARNKYLKDETGNDEEENEEDRNKYLEVNSDDEEEEEQVSDRQSSDLNVDSNEKEELSALRQNFAENTYTLEGNTATFGDGHVENRQETNEDGNTGTEQNTLRVQQDYSGYTLDKFNDSSTANTTDDQSSEELFYVSEDKSSSEEEENVEVSESESFDDENKVRRTKYLHEETSDDNSDEDLNDSNEEGGEDGNDSSEEGNEEGNEESSALRDVPDSLSPSAQSLENSSYTFKDGVNTFSDGRKETVVKSPEEFERDAQRLEAERKKLEEAARKEEERKGASRQAGGKNAFMDKLDEIVSEGDVPLTEVGQRQPKPMNAPLEGEDLVDDVNATLDDKGEEVSAKLLKTREQEDQYLEKLRQERLAEAKSAGEEIRKGLRPEDRKDIKERELEGYSGTVKDNAVSEGQAPEVDLKEWNKEVGNLSEALDKLDKEKNGGR